MDAGLRCADPVVLNVRASRNQLWVLKQVVRAAILLENDYDVLNDGLHCQGQRGALVGRTRSSLDAEGIAAGGSSLRSGDRELRAARTRHRCGIK